MRRYLLLALAPLLVAGGPKHVDQSVGRFTEPGQRAPADCADPARSYHLDADGILHSRPVHFECEVCLDETRWRCNIQEQPGNAIYRFVAWGRLRVTSTSPREVLMWTEFDPGTQWQFRDRGADFILIGAPTGATSGLQITRGEYRRKPTP